MRYAQKTKAKRKAGKIKICQTIKLKEQKKWQKQKKKKRDQSPAMSVHYTIIIRDRSVRNLTHRDTKSTDWTFINRQNNKLFGINSL
jgi:hypothetical protein